MITSFLLAATCGSVCAQSYVVRQKVVAPYAVQSYVAAPVYYFVGAPLRAESIVEHQKRSDPDWQEFQQFKAWKAGAAQAQKQPMQHESTAEAHQPMPPQQEIPRSQVNVENICAKCHGKAVPEAGFFLDGKPGMRAEDITFAIRKVADGSMPKDRKLTRDEKNAILMDLLRLEYQEDRDRANPPEESLPPLPQPSGGTQ